MLSRIVRDGMVAVIHSNEYGSGWYSYHDIEHLLFDPQIVQMIESGESSGTIYAYCAKEYNGFYKMYRHPVGLMITWVPVGTVFRISEYDGLEHVAYQSADQYVIA
jgi:hypothetical protein